MAFNFSGLANQASTAQAGPAPYDPTTDQANYGEGGQYLQGALMKFAATPQMQSKSWYPSYLKAMQSGDSGTLKYWAQNEAPKYSDFDGATDGDFVGTQVARMQGVAAKDKTQMGVNAAIGLGGLAIGAGAAGLFGGGAATAGAGAGAAGAGVSAGTAGAIEGGLATGGSLAGAGGLATAGAVGGDVLGGAGGAGTNAMTGAATTGVADGAGGYLDFINSPNFTGAFDPGGAGMTVGGPGGMASGAGSSLPFGLTSKDLAMGGINFGLNQYLAKQAHQAGQSAANTSNALNQPQRAPFQAAANDMVQNPQDYFKNNPFATSMADFYKNGVIPANIAKSGNTGFDTDRLGAQFATSVGNNYNGLLQQLQGFGGYNQGTGYAGNNQLTGDMAANQFQAESFRGAGKAAEGLFGSPDQPKTPQQNPITGSYTVIS